VFVHTCADQLLCCFSSHAPPPWRQPIFVLGLNYTQWGPNTSPGEQLAADNSGALYILDISASRLTKLAADGKTALWQQTLAPRVSAMAVDPNGGIYLIADPTGASAVEKLSAETNQRPAPRWITRAHLTVARECVSRDAGGIVP
jgi:hypothetical protein